MEDLLANTFEAISRQDIMPGQRETVLGDGR